MKPGRRVEQGCGPVGETASSQGGFLVFRGKIISIPFGRLFADETGLVLSSSTFTKTKGQLPATT